MGHFRLRRSTILPLAVLLGLTLGREVVAVTVFRIPVYLFACTQRDLERNRRDTPAYHREHGSDSRNCSARLCSIGSG